MSSLAEFLHARLDEDKQAALAVGAGSRWEHRARHSSEVWLQDTQMTPRVEACNAPTAAHIARHDPARVLREVEAKRRILEIHAGGHECASYDSVSREISNGVWVMDGEDCTTVRLLALPYFDHPNYDEGWRP